MVRTIHVFQISRYEGKEAGVNGYDTTKYSIDTSEGNRDRASAL